MEPTADTTVDLARKCSTDVFEALLNQATSEHEQPSRIPVPVQTPRLGNDVPLESKATVTKIEVVPDEKSVVTLMPAENSEMSASSSFTMMVEIDKPKKITKKSTQQRQLESQLQIKTSSRASFARQKDSHASLVSSEALHPSVQLPHKLGKLPAYIRNRPTAEIKPKSAIAPPKPMDALSASSTLSRLSTAPAPCMTSPPATAAKHIETLERSNNSLAMKTIELTKQVKDHTKALEDSKKKIEDAEAALVVKEQQLKDKTNRIRDLETQKSKLQRDSKKVSEDVEKITSLDTQLAALQKEKEVLTRKISQKDSIIEKQRIENHRLEKELKKTSDLNDEIFAKAKNLDNGDDGAQKKYESVIKDLKAQLKQRDTEISSLKRDSSSLNEENRSLKSQSLELVKVKPSSDRESLDLKKSEDVLKQEINKLNSMLEDATHKNFRHENLLHLRGEYIKTLQETDEVNKSRLILQIKDNEDLRMKVEKLRKFKAASNEELNNMKNTLTNQEREIQQLQQTLEFKEEKILLLKQLRAQTQGR